MGWGTRSAGILLGCLLAPLAQAQVDLEPFLKQDVLKPTREKFDMIGAHNFSAYIFHERAQMLQYARSAYRSLKSTGTFFIEMAGGDGFVEEAYEPQDVKIDAPFKQDPNNPWTTHTNDHLTAWSGAW